MFSIATSVVLRYCVNLNWIVQTVVFALRMCTVKEYAVPHPGYIYISGCKMHGESWGGAVGRVTALQAGKSRVRFPMASLGFFTDILSFEGGSSRSHYVESSLWKRLWTCRKTDYWMNEYSFRSHCGTWVDSAFNRNEWQEYFLEVKTAGA
jgi:hypothetical protein